MPFTTVNNVKLFYDQQGYGEDLILLGGMTAHHMVWNAMLPFLVNNYRVLRPDNRGAGQSQAPEEKYSIADMAKDIIGLMDELQIEKASIAGHSMGGMMLQYLLLNYPQRIHKAIICASASKVPEAGMFSVRSKLKLMQANIDKELICEVSLPWIFGNKFLSDKDRVENTLNIMLNNPYPQSQLGYEGQVHAVDNFDFRNKLHAVKIKTLILAGADDLLTPAFCSRQIHEQMPLSIFKIIENVGHCFHMEDPKKVSQEFVEFLGASNQ